MPRGNTDLAALMGRARRRVGQRRGSTLSKASLNDGKSAASAQPEGVAQSSAFVHNALPQAAAWRYGRQLLQAIAHVHSKGVVHNDVKLENVVLTSNNTAQLMVRVL